MTIVGASTYLIATTVLSIVATASARRNGDRLDGIYLAICISIGLLAALVDPSHGLIFACVAVCAATDISSGYIYDAVLFVSCAGIFAMAMLGDQLPDAFLGAGVGFIVPWALWLLTQRRGLGFGDVKLFGVIGAALGVVGSLAAFGMSFVIGAVSILSLAWLGSQVSRIVRFAPYIALGTLGSATRHHWYMV